MDPWVRGGVRGIEPELAEDMRDMLLDGLHRQVQLSPDTGVGPPLRHECKYRALPFGKGVDERAAVVQAE
jgi:hypothetical protein